MAQRQLVRSVLAIVTAVALSTLVAVGSAPARVAPQAGAQDRPTRVLVIVLDQLRPEFIEAFDMQNVQALMAGGTNFRRAWLGHMGSETVISHNVMTSGQQPKHMGWSDEWYRDVDGVLGAPDTMYVSGSMSRDQFNDIISTAGYPKLQDYLGAAYPDRVTAAVGQKAYAVNTMAGPATDIQVTMSSRNFDCDGQGFNWRGPVGSNSWNVPDYIASPECGRFYINSSRSLDYGTATTSPAWMYPLDGNRDTPGKDPDHYGGDRWVADAALKIMRNEDWSGLFVTMGGIDKAAHMWGGLNDRPPFPPGAKDPRSHLPRLAQVADRQLGRLLEGLEQTGTLDETLIVLTTDHAQLQSKNYYGEDGAGRGNFNWYYGQDADETYLDPQPALEPLLATGNVRTSMQDSAIRTWLIDTSRTSRQEAADVMADLPGVIASYYRQGDHYVLRSRAPRSEFTTREWNWWRLTAQRIVNSEAAPYGPDVIGLLHDDTSYGVAGDHGGAQRSVQRIPIVFSGPGVEAGRQAWAPIRSVDIMPTILRELGIAEIHPTDGIDYALP